ncbi:hypothetical protein G6F30_006105 [Rhizopus arrhizus]|nr:hypothetical protein G6F30_006105 [Rhizopus arrhizus]
MSSLIVRSFRLQSLRQLIKPNSFKRCHSTSIVTSTVSNDNGRLRVEEEKYADVYSSSIQQPYRDVLESLAKRTENEFSNANMMITSLQGKLMCQLIKLFRPRNVLEIGGFTGYSAIAMGSGLPSKAKLTSLELNEKHAKVAEEYIRLAKLQNKIEIKVGPASESIGGVNNKAPGGDNELMFFDADKGSYINYYELIMKHNLLSDRGVLVVDNVLFFGQVHGQAGFGHTEAEVSKNIRKQATKVHNFNAHIAKDPRVELVILPLFDGLTLIRKRDPFDD